MDTLLNSLAEVCPEAKAGIVSITTLYVVAKECEICVHGQSTYRVGNHCVPLKIVLSASNFVHNFAASKNWWHLAIS